MLRIASLRTPSTNPKYKLDSPDYIRDVQLLQSNWAQHKLHVTAFHLKQSADILCDQDSSTKSI